MKRPALQKKVVPFLQGNAPAHKSRQASAKLAQLRFELIEQPSYSPDLAPSDYFLFGHLKNSLGGKRFSSNEEVKAAVNAYFQSNDAEFYSRGMKALKSRWEKCIELLGEYIE